jgi:hypothetical protein
MCLYEVLQIVVYTAFTVVYACTAQSCVTLFRLFVLVNLMYLQLDHALLGPLLSRDGIGAYGEATFLYKPTGTLLVTDVVIQVR